MKGYEKLEEFKVIPVVVINKIEDAIPTMDALVKGGLPAAEITFRTECAPEAIKLAIEKYPDAYIGAGTVINKEQCEEAIKLGCKFIVSPGLSKEVAEVCKKHDIVYLPGVVTPTEVMEALSLGINVVKFFPASNYGGLATIKALCGPFPQIKVMPTGGISDKNILEYLACDKIIACGGSWMCKGTPEEIYNKTKEAVALVRGK